MANIIGCRNPSATSGPLKFYAAAYIINMAACHNPMLPAGPARFKEALGFTMLTQIGN
jgi:hypothetical protein